MRISLGPDISPPTGQHPLSVRLSNRGSATCLLDGYPSVALLDGRGRVLPFVIRDGGGQVVTSRPPAKVRVRPGGLATVVLSTCRCDLGDVYLARVLRLGLPGVNGENRLRLRIPRGFVIGYCGKRDPGSIVYVSPVEPGLREALAH